MLLDDKADARHPRNFKFSNDPWRNENFLTCWKT